MFSVLDFAAHNGELGIKKTVKQLPCALDAHAYTPTFIEGQYQVAAEQLDHLEAHPRQVAVQTSVDSRNSNRSTREGSHLIPIQEKTGVHGDLLKKCSSACGQSAASLAEAASPNATDAASQASNQFASECKNLDGCTIGSEFSAKRHSMWREKNAAM